MNIEEQEQYGVWITDQDGSNGRWMSDQNNNKDIWVGSRYEAVEAVGLRKGLYQHIRYEIKIYERN